MPDAGPLRIGREIFLAAFALDLDKVDAWVVDRVASILEEAEVHAGQALFTAGDRPEFVYFMQDGEVRFTREGGPSWIQRGRWILGGFDALGDRPATYTATALGDFHGMKAPSASWVEMLEDSFPLARSAVVNAARVLMRLEERVPTGAPVSDRETSLLSSAPPGALSVVQRLALLVDLRMLRVTGVQALADLAADSQQVGFAKGELLFGQSGEREHLIRIVDGDVVAERDAPAMVRRYGPGDLVCGTAILGRVAGAWNARAMTPIRAISFPLEALFDLMEEHFDLVRSMLAAMGGRRELLLEHMASRSSDLILT
jgi:CRP-like cAMP-binding protein